MLFCFEFKNFFQTKVKQCQQQQQQNVPKLNCNVVMAVVVDSGTPTGPHSFAKASKWNLNCQIQAHYKSIIESLEQYKSWSPLFSYFENEFQIKYNILQL